jgi:hypothetical protein
MGYNPLTAAQLDYLRGKREMPGEHGIRRSLVIRGFITARGDLTDEGRKAIDD